MPHPIRATNDRELAGTGIVRAAGELAVDRFQGCGPDVQDGLVLARLRLGELLKARGLA